MDNALAPADLPQIRGSRKHILDWTSQPRSMIDLLSLVRPVDCRLTRASCWMPMGYAESEEARLERFGPMCMPDHAAWPAIASWWLRHPRGANTPNWDLALSCDVQGTPGLILVEAKANVPELSPLGKPKDPAASSRSAENHEHIGRAIDDVCREMQACIPGLSIGRDTHYQLSNRIAFGWKLASLRIPTVLVYLGFTGDTGIGDVGEPFASDEHWQRVFHGYLGGVCPHPDQVLDRPLPGANAPMWILSRSRAVLEASLPRR